MELNEQDKQMEMKNRKTNKRYNHSRVVAVQAQGPLHRLVVPTGHSRLSRHIPLLGALQDALEVNVAADLHYGGVVEPSMGQLVQSDLENRWNDLEDTTALTELDDATTRTCSYGNMLARPTVQGTASNVAIMVAAGPAVVEAAATEHGVHEYTILVWCAVGLTCAGVVGAIWLWIGSTNLVRVAPPSKPDSSSSWPKVPRKRAGLVPSWAGLAWGRQKQQSPHE